MSQREKIILGILPLVILYGVYALFFSSPPGKDAGAPAAQERLTELRDLATKISTEMRQGDLTATERYILERADADWTSDPFIGKTLMASTAAAGSVRAGEPGFEYTGFVDTGMKQLAVINGMEYEIGEYLVAGGYIVQSIDPGAVVLEEENNRGRVTVPFSGEVF